MVSSSMDSSMSNAPGTDLREVFSMNDNYVGVLYMYTTWNRLYWGNIDVIFYWGWSVIHLLEAKDRCIEISDNTIHTVEA